MKLILNLKMNFTKDKILAYADEINDEDVIVLPQYPYISFFENAKCKYGSQNVSEHISGSYTGEVCAKALKDLGCSYVLVHHFERESVFDETLDVAKDKIINVIDHDMIPIYCINDDKCDISNRLEILNEVNGDIVIAYEPTWLIGKELNESDYLFIKERILYIKDYMRDLNIKYDLVYGGGINSDNIDLLINENMVDGFIVSSNILSLESYKELYNKIKY